MAFRPHCQKVLYTIHKTEYIAYDTEDDHNTDMKSELGLDVHACVTQSVFDFLT